MAGMSAALTAAEHGAQVVVVEKGPAVGGSARMSSGNVWTHVDLETVRSLIPRGNPVLQGLVLDNFEASVEWLKDLGVHCGPERPLMEYGHGWKVDPAELFAVFLKH